MYQESFADVLEFKPELSDSKVKAHRFSSRIEEG